MDIKLLGPELENVQNAAQREIDDTIERRKKEVEKEVLDNLSEIASDGKRVLKSQKETYEMMLELDGIVKDNEDLFLKVNSLCDKTGVSLNAIIGRMVEKNRELRGEQPAIDPVSVELPSSEDLDKKKADDVSLSFTNPDVPTYEIPRIEIDYDPDDIKYDWQKDAFSQEEDIKPVVPLENSAPTETTNVLPTEYSDVPSASERDYMIVKGRRLCGWESSQQRNNAIIRTMTFGENFEGKSDDYRNISTQIGNLLLNYRAFTPEEDNVSLDTLDQAIGASNTLTVDEKRTLYRKLNVGAKKVERYAQSIAR